MYPALPLSAFTLFNKMSGLNSFASEIAIKKLLFFGRLSLSPIWLQLSEICSKVDLRATLT